MMKTAEELETLNCIHGFYIYQKQRSYATGKENYYT